MSIKNVFLVGFVLFFCQYMKANNDQELQRLKNKFKISMAKRRNVRPKESTVGKRKNTKYADDSLEKSEAGKIKLANDKAIVKEYIKNLSFSEFIPKSQDGAECIMSGPSLGMPKNLTLKSKSNAETMLDFLRSLNHAQTEEELNLINTTGLVIDFPNFIEAKRKAIQQKKENSMMREFSKNQD